VAVLHMKRTQGRNDQDHLSDAAPNADGGSLQEIIASSGITPRFWRLYAYFWLVCLVFPILYLAHTPLTIIRLLVALSGLTIFVAVYLWVMWPYPLRNLRDDRFKLAPPSVILLGITLLVLFLSLTYGSTFTWLFLGVSAITGVMLPARRAFWTVSGLTLLTLGVSVIVSGGILSTDWLQVIPLVLLVRGLGLDITGLTRLAEALRELNLARQELAHQAVVEERLRMARDLHDLLGHTLSLITLKSELAGRLVENDPSQAVQEIHEVERVARQALREVRQAVAGYRQQPLADELDGARQILEAAGIDCRIDNAAEILSPGIDAALAWTVREAVTNVIRHSRAKQCLIRITSQGAIIRAEVINDGYRESENAVNGRGSGLSGLAERLAVQDGNIETGPFSFENRPGFRLKVEIPVQSNMAPKEALRR
jgi:two-component system, NarL family, sensor histidine kinase DesK